MASPNQVGGGGGGGGLNMSDTSSKANSTTTAPVAARLSASTVAQSPPPNGASASSSNVAAPVPGYPARSSGTSTTSLPSIHSFSAAPAVSTTPAKTATGPPGPTTSSAATAGGHPFSISPSVPSNHSQTRQPSHSPNLAVASTPLASNGSDSQHKLNSSAPVRFTAAGAPYTSLPSLSNSGAGGVKSLATPSPQPGAAAGSSAATSPRPPPPRLPGVSSMSSPPAVTSVPGMLPPSMSSAPPAASSTAAASSSSAYRNPMSVSSILSGPSRDRPLSTYPQASKSATSAAVAAASSAPPQPPVLPPAPPKLGGQNEMGKSAAQALGYRRVADVPMSVASKPSETGKSPTPTSASSDKPKDSASTTSKSSYPPLPSAYARESPYSTWNGGKKDDKNSSTPQGAGGPIKIGSHLHHQSPQQPQTHHQQQAHAQQQPHKTSFFPSLNSFNRPPAGSTGPPNHRQGTGAGSYPPPGQASSFATYPWSNPAQQQQQQQHQQQAPQTSLQYSDFWRGRNGPATDDKRTAEASTHPTQRSQHQYGSASPSTNAAGGGTNHSALSSNPYANTFAHASRTISAGGTPLLGPSSTTNASTPSSTVPVSAGAPSPSPSSWAPNDPALNAGGPSSTAHKRRRSDGVASLARPDGSLAPSTGDAQSKFSNNNKQAGTHVTTPPVPVAATAPVMPPRPPPFTAAEARKAMVRPPLVRVDNEAVVRALDRAVQPVLLAGEKAKSDSAPHKPSPSTASPPRLGRVIYDPFLNPATLLDGEILRANIGGVLEVAVSAGWLRAGAGFSGVSYDVGDPATFTGLREGGDDEQDVDDDDEVRIPPNVWELEGFRKRRVWGADVYTDDSDVLAMAVHSGWLRFGTRVPALVEDKAAAAEKSNETLLVRLRVAPRLVRYQGCERSGLKSRSWGNGHDGVSLMVESVQVVKDAQPPRPRGRKWLKRRLPSALALDTASSVIVPLTLTHAQVAAPPRSVEVRLLEAEGGNGSGEGKTVAVSDTFVLAPLSGHCAFVGQSAAKRQRVNAGPPLDGLGIREVDQVVEGETRMEVD